MQPTTTLPFYGTPSEGQAYRIQQIISRREEELAQIDSNIIRVRSLLQQLLSDRNDIRESLEAHKALIALPPIRAFERVPLEIWQQIFVASVGVTWEAPKYPRIDVHKPPLLLGRICRSWRAVSAATPRLWSSICISGRTRASAIPMIETWLDCSGALPLSLDIHGLSSNFPSAVLNILIPYSSRWQNLSLFMSNKILADLFAKPGLTLSSLKTFMLHMQGRPQRFKIGPSATGLRTVTLLVSRIQRDPHTLDLPWAQLTNLCLTFMAGSLGDGYDILAQCFALTHCTLCSMGSATGAIDRPPIRLPNLSSLRLMTNRNPEHLLDALVLPCLIQLEIDFIDTSFEPNIWPKTQVMALVARSSCHLQSLTLRDKVIPEGDLVECCRCMPSLVHLMVTDRGKKRVPVYTLELIRARNPDLDVRGAAQITRI